MMGEGNARVSLILELKNKLKSGMSQAKNNLNRDVNDMKGKLAELKQSHTATFTSMQDQVPALGNALSLIGNPYMLMTAGLGALVVAGTRAATWANNWEQGMAKVNVTAQLTKKELESLSNKIIDIGKRNTTPIEEIPDAFNMIISAGLEVNTSLQVLEPTLRAAKAGFADLKTVATAATSVMLSSGENVNTVYDILFATMNKGKAEFSDIANYLPRIVPQAKALGISLAEVGGLFASMSTKFRPEASATMLQNVFKAFGTLDIRKSMEAYGVKVFDKGKIRPFLDIIGDVKKAVAGLTPEAQSNMIEKMGFDTEARTAILTMIQDMAQLKTNIDFTTNSAGQLDKAFEMSKTRIDEWKIISNQLKTNIWKPLGEWFLNQFTLIGRDILWLTNSIKKVNNYFSSGGLVKDLEILFKSIGNFLSEIGNVFAPLLKGDFKKFYVNALTFNRSGDDNAFQVKSSNPEKPTYMLPSAVGSQGYTASWRNNIKSGDPENPFSMVPEDPSTPKVPDSKPASSSIDNIVGSAKQIRNFEVKIGNMVENLNANNTETKDMSGNQMEQYFTELFMRVIRNIETSYQ